MKDNNVLVNVRMPYKWKAALSELADEDERTVSYLIRKLVRQHLSNVGKLQAPGEQEQTSSR